MDPGTETFSVEALPADPAQDGLGPSAEEWAALSSRERDRLVGRLIEDCNAEELIALQTMAEGDPHQDACDSIRDTLRSFFGQRQASIYVGANLPISYPRERTFSPDVIVATEVRPGPRDAWIVAAEGKGLDLALEVHRKGSWRKDFVDNVKKYARLGIREYFAFDLNRLVMVGYRLPPAGRKYDQIGEQRGRFHSEVLGMDLMVVGGQVSFFLGTARLLTIGEQTVQERERADQERERADQERERFRAARAGAILEILKLRQIAIGDEVRARIGACQDIDLLERWFQQALVVLPEEIAASFR